MRMQFGLLMLAYCVGAFFGWAAVCGLSVATFFIAAWLFADTLAKAPIDVLGYVYPKYEKIAAAWAAVAGLAVIIATVAAIRIV